jgi:hypothetical protein
MPRGPLLGVAVVAAALAATAAWGLGESGLFQFRPAITNLSMMGHAYRDSSPQTREIAMLKGVSCLLGSLGALLGLGMGLAAGQFRRSRRQALIAVGVGFLAGGMAGAAPVWIVIPLYNRAEELTAGDLGRSLLLHWGLWTAMGAAAGLALGIGLGARFRVLPAILGGIIGAVAGTFLFDLLGGLAFPLAETGKPLADTAVTRLMAMLFVAVSSALGAVLLATSTGSSTRKAAPSMIR